MTDAPETVFRVGDIWLKSLPREIVRIIDKDGIERRSTEGLSGHRIQWRRQDPGYIRHNTGEMWKKWAAEAQCTRRAPAW